jgi:hypothetical protein
MATQSKDPSTDKPQETTGPQRPAPEKVNFMEDIFGAKANKNRKQAKADQVAAENAAVDQARADDDAKTTKEYTKSLSGNVERINTAVQKGAIEDIKAGTQYSTETEKLKGETKDLKKYTEGIETNYEKIAQRYRDAFDEADKLRVKEQSLAQRDYAANTALMSRAASVGMSGQGPMTGSQQQLMMAGAQQQATMAYSQANDRMQSMQMQRQNLGAQTVQASMQQEMQNRQAGFSMDAQNIQARNVLNTQQYGTDLNSNASWTNAVTSSEERRMGVTNAGMQQTIALRGMREGVAMSEAQINAAGGGGQSQLGTGLQRALTGAAAGASAGSAGGPWGALAGGIGGGLLGFGSAYT